jgi:hypothetical protein
MPTLSVGRQLAEPSIATALPLWPGGLRTSRGVDQDSLPLLSWLSEGYEIAPGFSAPGGASNLGLRRRAAEHKVVVSVALMSADGKSLAEALSVRV